MAVGVMGSSTPTGRRGLFYKYCTDPNTGFKEFHYTFYDSPTYLNATDEQKDQMERELRHQFPDELSYQHEILAEFGAEAMGVYNKKCIDRARSYSVADGQIGDPDKVLLWDYNQTRHNGYLTNKPIMPTYSTIRTVGVDWDKMGAPTEIVVTEWSPYEVNSSGRKGMFRIIGRFEIERSDFTLTNAVDKIIEINQAFNPDYIYVDRGYGETQVELLHKYGVDHPESGLGRKVKAITFQGKIPVKDPFTGETDDKHVKPFLVNNSIHILDSDLLQLNDEDTLLWRQMENYQVVGVSTYGLPTYSKKDEHALDAMNLSLLAMTLVMSLSER
jgi:replicative DNA helicase